MLGHRVDYTVYFEVTIIDRMKLSSDGTCYLMNASLLPLQVSNLVLGIQWLEGIRDVTSNFQHLTMNFVLEDGQ